MTPDLFNLSKSELIEELWTADKNIRRLLVRSDNFPHIRDSFFEYLNRLERRYFNIYADKKYSGIHIIERNNAKECIRVLKNIIRTENEKLTGFSALYKLHRIALNDREAVESVSEGFLLEFIHLFRGINGNSGIADTTIILDGEDSEISDRRTEKLNEYAMGIREKMSEFKPGNHPVIEEKRKAMKRKILSSFKANEENWQDYTWHLKHIIKDKKVLADLIVLSEEEKAGLAAAEKYHIPFQITPYYLSLFSGDPREGYDRSIRAMVLPSETYCNNVHINRVSKKDMDFMGERSTSPIDGITRRYPHIVILKPFNSCPQICVYCQRNWEITEIADTRISFPVIKKAIRWIKENENITEVLVTGGDPLTMNNRNIDRILSELSQIPHVERIRIGTRVFVTLPFRLDDELVGIVGKYHQPGKREICFITHFEHFSEITDDVIRVVSKIRRAGLSIYNQQVFTYYNSFKFETSFLRKTLKLAGIDPYYTFNTKGKDETVDFRVPIARIEQERKEEARFLPGIIRTDEPVFNLPKLGKSHLRAWQEHEPVMILETGERIYRFFAWESKVTLVEDYLYKDVPVYDYLKRIRADGGNINDYSSIWYYF